MRIAGKLPRVVIQPGHARRAGHKRTRPKRGSADVRCCRLATTPQHSSVIALQPQNRAKFCNRRQILPRRPSWRTFIRIPQPAADLSSEQTMLTRANNYEPRRIRFHHGVEGRTGSRVSATFSRAPILPVRLRSHGTDRFQHARPSQKKPRAERSQRRVNEDAGDRHKPTVLISK